jgi:hypothetical protein
MEDLRFDSLVKAVAMGASRRRVLKGLLGLGGVSLIGSATLGDGAEAARRPTPTPKPPTCPGRQIWQNGQCVCPGDAPEKCGPACCTGDSIEAPNPGHSECCDNACCFGTCYGEELCCPTNQIVSGGQLLPPIATYCEATNECCYAPNVCCGDAGCCSAEQCASGSCCPVGTAACGVEDPVCCDPERCTAGGQCCGGDELICGDECCTEDRCLPEVGCCPEGTIACGGACCDAEVYFCNEYSQCECLPGTEPCGELPGGCCPIGQCNEASQCCVTGTTACGESCCDNATEECAEGSCVCLSGLIRCEGSCIEAQCCGSDTFHCVEQGYDADCVVCSSGSCEAANEFEPCSTGSAGSGWCNSGVCTGCLPPQAECVSDNQCCTGRCLGNQRCDSN